MGRVKRRRDSRRVVKYMIKERKEGVKREEMF